MDIILTLGPTLIALTGLITAVAGIRRAARKDDLDALRAIIAIQDQQLAEQHERLDQQSLELRENRHARIILQGRIAELVRENTLLHQEIGKLQQQIREATIAHNEPYSQSPIPNTQSLEDKERTKETQ